MIVSILGPTSLEKFSARLERPRAEIAACGRLIGAAIASSEATLRVVFNYAGMLKVIGDAHMENGGSLEMLYTRNDADWATAPYLDNLAVTPVTREYGSWHVMLLALVSDSDIVVCAGISAGVLVELGYMKWNVQEGKGRTKRFIGVVELLPQGAFPREFDDLVPYTTFVSAHELAAHFATV